MARQERDFIAPLPVMTLKVQRAVASYDNDGIWKSRNLLKDIRDFGPTRFRDFQASGSFETSHFHQHQTSR